MKIVPQCNCALTGHWEIWKSDLINTYINSNYEIWRLHRSAQVHSCDLRDILLTIKRLMQLVLWWWCWWRWWLWWDEVKERFLWSWRQLYNNAVRCNSMWTNSILFDQSIFNCNLCEPRHSTYNDMFILNCCYPDSNTIQLYLIQHIRIQLFLIQYGGIYVKVPSCRCADRFVYWFHSYSTLCLDYRKMKFWLWEFVF